MRVGSTGQTCALWRFDGFPAGGKTTMAGDPDHQPLNQRGLHRPSRLLQALSSPDSYGLAWGARSQLHAAGSYSWITPPRRSRRRNPPRIGPLLGSPGTDGTGAT
jgi:hypothetical protein